MQTSHACKAGVDSCTQAKTIAQMEYGQTSRSLVRSRGGFTTKLHAVSEGLGLPLRLIPSPGQEHDIKQAHSLVENLSPWDILTDKAYDADRLIETIQNTGAKVCIPPKRNRITQRDYDKDLYKERNQVECMFGRLKEFRRVATRYDKLITGFMGFVKRAAIYLWIK